MVWEVVIGMETHAQLATKSKIFSGSSTAFGAEPNRQASAVDLALPGVLPVLNREAVACAIRLGLAIGATVEPRSVFARKNYFYPDLPKGYQISQFEIPVVSGGQVSFVVLVDGKSQFKTLNLTRAHLEEDAGKSLHEDFVDASGIDLNRAGTPLLEIVTEPELGSSAEAVAYARALHGLVVWLGICDGNMQEGSFRCDANVSVRRPGEPLGTRCEIKNLNSFRFMERAIEFEIARQIELIEDGGRVVQETRLYDPDRDETRSMRSKEDAQDYRYFPDPDLPPLMIEPAWIEEVRTQMPELPDAMRERLVRDYDLPEYDASLLTASREIAAYFDSVMDGLKSVARDPNKLAKPAANWIMSDLSAAANRDEIDLTSSPVSPSGLAALVVRIDDGTISGKVAKELFTQLWQRGQADAATGTDATAALADFDKLIDDSGLRQINDDSALQTVIDEVIAANMKSVEQFNGGKDKALNSLVGQVMKATGGKANPKRINELLRETAQRLA